MSTSSRKKVAIVHPQLLRGGSETRALYAISALKDDYDVTLITSGDFSLDELNAYYGTQLKKGDFNVMVVKIPWIFGRKFDALRNFPLARTIRRVASEFDVMVSTYNVMDFGTKGIQFIADLSFDDQLRREFDPQPAKTHKWFYRQSFFRGLYLGFARVLSGVSRDGWKNNITIANSHWTADILKARHDIQARVIYPAVVMGEKGSHFLKKEQGFVCLGRISPEKEIEKIVRIISRVRKNHPDIRLHIVGGITDRVYGEYVKGLCSDNKDWCFFEGQLQGQKKLDFLAKHAYGISGRSNEPFGIAVAEMVKSGCLVFVPKGGGQAEIVNDEALIYQNEAEAVEKINKVLEDREVQAQLSAKLIAQSQKFSVENFQKFLRAEIADFLQKS